MGRLTRRGLIKTGAAGAAAAGVTGCSVGRSSAADGERPNVLLIVTDSMRADFIGAYDGDGRAETPNIDALADDGLRFELAVPEAMPTVAARRAILTGVRAFPFRDWKATERLPPFPGWSAIPERRPVFPELLSAAGVTTAYVTDNPFLIGPRFKSFRQTLDVSKSIFLQGGYRRYNRPLPEDELAPSERVQPFLLPGLEGTDAEQSLREHFGVQPGRRREEDFAAARVIGAGMDALDRLKERQPFFLGVDAFDPHEAFDPPVIYKQRFGERTTDVEPILPFGSPFSRVQEIDVDREVISRIRDLYAGEVSFVDAWIGRLMNKLDDLGLLDNTLVMYLSDHGVALGERGILGKYAAMLKREIYRVPFIIRHPDGKRAGETSDFFASTHDVAPTLLSFQGLTVPGQMDGEDLTCLFDNRDPLARPCWTTSYATIVGAGDGRWLLASDNQGERPRLFDTKTDPREVDDVAAAHPDVERRLWERILYDAGGTMPVFGDTEVIAG